MTLVDQIRDLISEGQTEKSLDELYKFVKENNADIIDNLVMLRNRMQSVERAVNVGTMSSSEAALEKAKINDAILKLLPQLTPEYLAEASKRKTAAPPASTPPGPTAPARNSSNLYMIIGGLGGALLLIILLVVWANGCDDEPTGTQTDNQEMLDSPPTDGNAAPVDKTTPDETPLDETNPGETTPDETTPDETTSDQIEPDETASDEHQEEK